MRHHSDFTAYAVARWTSLVRSLVLLGSPPVVAEDIAVDALARCYPRWKHIQDDIDIDAHVYRTLLECRGRNRTDWWSDDPSRSAEPDALEAALDRLSPEDRQVLVLRFVADLSETQVADVLGMSLASVRARSTHSLERINVAADETFREAGDAIVVLPPEPNAIGLRVREHRGRRRIAVLLVSAGVLAVVGLGTWIGTRPAQPDLSLTVAPTELQENPSGLTWFANGALHLEHVVITLPPMQEVVVVTGGAVYGDAKGNVVLVGDDGARTLLGTRAPGSALVASDAQGWVAWVDPGGGSAEIVVYDLTSRTVLAHADVSGPAAESHPIAIDQDKVYFATRDGEYEWQPLSGDPTPVTPSGLLDVSSATRAFQVDPETISIEQPFFNIVLDRLGTGARLSYDGDYVLTRTPDPRSVYGTVHIYDTRSGDEITSGLKSGELAIAAELGLERTVTYIVALAKDKPQADDFVRLSFSGPFELRTCSFDTGVCVVDAKIPNAGSTPLLAQ